MTGIQEILTLLVILAGIIMLPRLFQGRKKTKQRVPRKKRTLSGGIRLGILVSVLVPVVTALVLKPWSGDLSMFVIVGIVPVFAGWGIFWVLSGFRHRKS